MSGAALCSSCGAPFEEGAMSCRYCHARRPLTPEEEKVRVFLEAMEQRLQCGKDYYGGRLVAAFAIVLAVTIASYFAFALIGTGFWGRLACVAAVFVLGVMFFGFYVLRMERKGLTETYRLTVAPEMERFAAERGTLVSDLQLHAARLLPAGAHLRKFLFGGQPTL